MTTDVLLNVKLKEETLYSPVPNSAVDWHAEGYRKRDSLLQTPLVLLGKKTGSKRVGGRCFRIWTGILGKIKRKGIWQCQISKATTHYAVVVRRLGSTLCSWIGHLSGEDDREQSALLCVVASYMSRLRPPSRCTLGRMTADGFSVFFLVRNENSSHFLRVLPEGGLCFVVWMSALISWATSAIRACGRVLQRVGT